MRAIARAGSFRFSEPLLGGTSNRLSADLMKWRIRIDLGTQSRAWQRVSNFIGSMLGLVMTKWPRQDPIASTVICCPTR
jgi:hypothetical protein